MTCLPQLSLKKSVNQTHPHTVIRSWRRWLLKLSKSSRTTTTGGRPQWRSDSKFSSSAPDTEDDSNGLFNAADAFLSELSLDLTSVSTGLPFPTGPRDFLGVPRLVGVKVLREQSSEPRMPVLAVTGDAGNFGFDGFLTWELTGEVDSEGDPKFPSGNSSRCNTTTSSLTGVLTGETDNTDDPEFPSVTHDEFDFPSECFSKYGSFSDEEFILVGKSLCFDDVTNSRNFWGVAPLRRPALEAAGDAGYFRGDLSAGGVRFWRFTGVPVGVLDVVRFGGEAKASVPSAFPPRDFLRARAAAAGPVWKI